MINELKKCHRCGKMVKSIRCRVPPIGSESHKREIIEKYGDCDDCIKEIDRIVGEALA